MDEADVGGSAVPVPAAAAARPDPLSNYPNLESIVVMADLGAQDARGNPIPLKSIDDVLQAIVALSVDEIRKIRKRMTVGTLETLLTRHPEFYYADVVRKSTQSRGSVIDILYTGDGTLARLDAELQKKAEILRDTGARIIAASDRIEREKASYRAVAKNALVAQTHTANFVSSLPAIERRERARNVVAVVSAIYLATPSSALNGSVMAKTFAQGINPVKKAKIKTYNEKFERGNVSTWEDFGQTFAWSKWVEMALYYARLSNDHRMVTFLMHIAMNKYGPENNDTEYGVRVLAYVMWHAIVNGTTILAWARRETARFDTNTTVELEEPEPSPTIRIPPVDFANAAIDEVRNAKVPELTNDEIDGLTGDTQSLVKSAGGRTIDDMTNGVLPVADLAYIDLDTANGMSDDAFLASNIYESIPSSLLVRNLLKEANILVEAAMAKIKQLDADIIDQGSDVSKIQNRIGLLYTMYIANRPDRAERWMGLGLALEVVRQQALQRMTDSLSDLVVLRRTFQERRTEVERDEKDLLEEYKKVFGEPRREGGKIVTYHAPLIFSGNVASLVATAESLLYANWGEDRVVEFRRQVQTAAMMGTIIEYQYLKQVQATGKVPTHMRQADKLAANVNHVINNIGLIRGAN